MKSSCEQNWFPALDGLRAVAAFGVVVDHFYPHQSILQRWFHFGRFGVDIFFVLSGFLICRNLLRLKADGTGRSNSSLFGEFYLKRSLRIFPIYYLTIAALCLTAIGPTRECLWWLLTYTSNIGIARHIEFGNLEHFWTLCVEEQFYVFVPALMILLPSRLAVCILVTFCGLGVAAKTTLGYVTHDWLVSTTFVFENLEGLTYGACIAHVWTNRERFRKFMKIALALFLPGVILLLYLQYMRATMGPSVYSVSLYIGGIDTAITLTFGPVVFLCITSNQSLLKKALEFQPLRYLGRISYGTYVYHYALIPFFPRIFASLGFHRLNPWDSPLAFFIAVVIVYALSAASWHFFEEPILKLKNLFERPILQIEHWRPKN